MAAKTGPQLYGAGRTARLQALTMKDTLVKSSVLQAGEYNLGQPGWATSFKADFPGQRLDRSHTIAITSHIKHNFDLGNDSGKRVPLHTYVQSTTRDDYGKKDVPRTQILREDRTVNWPDMAPQYMKVRNVGQSEYANNFAPGHQRSNSAPAFPKVDTSKMALPLDPAKFHHQRGSRFQFGSDEKSHLSEQQRAYGRVNAQEDMTHKLPRDLKSDVGRKMKDADNKSNVFRSGDYDNIVGGNPDTTTVSDFGPRTRDPKELFASQILQQRMPSKQGRSPKVRPTTDVPNELANYARCVTAPETIREADDGRVYQTNAHFKFGFDPNQKASIYGKDYALAAMADRKPPVQQPTPDAGSLFQNDPQYGGKATSLKSTDYSRPPPQVKSTILQDNLDKWSGNNIVMSYDTRRHISDRQNSLSHHDYTGPPPGYKPLVPLGERAVPYPFLETDTALPYPGLPRQSEAANNFAGALSSGVDAVDRVRTRTDVCRERFLDRKATHFTVGYQPRDFQSLNVLDYQGKRKNDANVPPAGKTETKPESDFFHIGHSANTSDLRAADPHVTSKMEGLHARHLHALPEGEAAFDNSVMKSDFMPGKRLTADQQRTVEKYERLLAKPFSRSHFFHSDNSGRNNYVSTTMDDFIQPDTMTGGRKMLAAK